MLRNIPDIEDSRIIFSLDTAQNCIMGIICFSTVFVSATSLLLCIYRRIYTTRKKWNESDKKCPDGSDKSRCVNDNLIIRSILFRPVPKRVYNCMSTRSGTDPDEIRYRILFILFTSLRVN